MHIPHIFQCLEHPFVCLPFTILLAWDPPLLVIHLRLISSLARNHVSRSWHHCHDIHLLCSQTTIYKKQKTKMSLASSPDFQIRPEDKAFDMLFPADDPPTNSFDEYLNENCDFDDGDNKETFDDF